jgi:hypothetical protein
MTRHLLCLAMLAASGCATFTPAPRRATHEFTETQIDERTWIVTFQGRGQRNERFQDFVLLRGAELSLAAGCGYFVVLGPGDSSTLALLNSSSGAVAAPVVKQKFGRSNTVYCMEEREEDVPVLLYNASFVKRSIGNKYGLVSRQTPTRAKAPPEESATSVPFE